jgi:chemotaxis protein MotB
MVYPKMPVPKRESDPRMPHARGSRIDRKKAALYGGMVLAGVALGFVVRPLVMADSRVGELESKLEETTKAATLEKTRADNLDKDVERVAAAKQAAEKQLVDAQKAQSELAMQVQQAETKAKEADAIKAKLKAAVDQSIGIVDYEGEQIRLRLVDKVMFKTLDDQLTDRGKKVLDRVALALKELPDKQIWVQGHTDDQPIAQPPVPRPPKPPPPKKGQKPAPPPPPPVAPAIKFKTNWELSAARALTVVHYLQDTAKVDPSRLAALAFGQYRPISRANRAANRRIEIVLYPKPVVKK